MNRKLLLKFVLLLIISSLVTFIVQRIFHIGFHDVKAFVQASGNWAPLVYSLVLFLGLSVPFNPVPDVLTVNLAALLFSPLVSILGTFASHLAALSFNYWVARKFGDSILRRLLNKEEFSRVEDLSKKLTLQMIFGLRFLLPITAVGIDAVSYAAGIARLNFSNFLIVSLIPWTFYSVVYFFSTVFLKNISPFLFFLPAILILGVPLVFLAFYHRKNLKAKVKAFLKI